MKHFFKRFAKIVVCFAVVLGSGALLTACSHEHDFGELYSYNETHHWKICSVKSNCDQTQDYGPHVFEGEWKTKTAKTCTTAEVEYRVCICGAEEYRDGDPASHNPESSYSHNETEHWYECVDCDTDLSKADHNIGDWQTLTDATCTVAEMQYHNCLCGYTELRSYGEALGHLASETYVSNTTHHWNTCQRTDCEEILNYAEHTMVEGVCSTCHYGAVASVGIEPASLTYYANLQTAVSNAQDNETITLLDNIDLPTAIEINKPITIELNDKILTIVTDTVGDGVFHVVTGGDLTINGNGIVNGVGNNKWNIVVFADGGDVTINGGTYTNLNIVKDPDDDDSNHYDVIYAKNGSTVTINDGIFMGTTPAWLLNVYDDHYKDGTTNIVVQGGTFIGFNPADCASEGENTNFVADGFKVISGNNTDYVVIPDV